MKHLSLQNLGVLLPFAVGTLCFFVSCSGASNNEDKAEHTRTVTTAKYRYMNKEMGLDKEELRKAETGLVEKQVIRGRPSAGLHFEFLLLEFDDGSSCEIRVERADEAQFLCNGKRFISPRSELLVNALRSKLLE